MKGIDKKNWEYAHRLFQCVAAASRPLRVNELAEFLAFDFEAGSTPTFLADWLPEDPTHAVLSICSSLLAVVKPNEGSLYDSPAVQFAHFSVKEYLTSARLAEAKDTISRFHFSMTTAHTIVTQGCLGALLHIGEDVTRDRLMEFPLALYAAENWVGHAWIENVSANVQDGMKRLFDPSKSHLSVWTWMTDPKTSSRGFLDSESPDQARATPLHYAACCGMHDVVKFLIVEHSQDVNARGFNSGETPLHVATECRHADIAQLLLEHGADANAQDMYERTPLLMASENGLGEIARVLLKHGADTELGKNGGQSLLELASENGLGEIARVLLKSGADTELGKNGGQSPLELASTRGHVEVVRVLLEHGADVDAQDELENTPLHHARGEDVARCLLEHGADANALDYKSQNPLHYASSSGVARVLLEHGVDVNSRDSFDLTPLHVTFNDGVAQVLLEHGVDANARDTNNATPLHRASESGREGVTRVLLEYGVDANCRDANNATPLHLASSLQLVTMGRQLEVVRLLLHHGADIHARDDEGQTPFIRATEAGKSDIMRLLLEYGAEDHRIVITTDAESGT